MPYKKRTDAELLGTGSGQGGTRLGFKTRSKQLIRSERKKEERENKRLKKLKNKKTPGGYGLFKGAKKSIRFAIESGSKREKHDVLKTLGEGKGSFRAFAPPKEKGRPGEAGVKARLRGIGRRADAIFDDV